MNRKSHEKKLLFNTKSDQFWDEDQWPYYFRIFCVLFHTRRYYKDKLLGNQKKYSGIEHLNYTIQSIDAKATKNFQYEFLPTVLGDWQIYVTKVDVTS